MKGLFWNCNGLGDVKPPRGRSGGMLVGVNLLVFDLGEIEEGDFFCAL
jgi:hypothetical protein